jgi:hypothetical protein
MIKKIVMGIVVVGAATGIGLYFWAQSALGTETVRNALAAQLSRALGQPVAVEGVRARLYPRLTVSLTGVTIGRSREIAIQAIDVGSNLGALLSRRIEGASLHVNGARLTLPIPPLALGNTAPQGTAPGAAVQLVSVDEVVLHDLEIVSRGRTLRGDIDLVPHGTTAVTLRRVALTADGAQIDATGEISNLAGPVGTLDLKAGALDLDQLMAVASDFAEGSGATPSAAPTDGAPGRTTPSAVDLTVTLTADKATMAGVSIERVTGRARLLGEQVTVEPLAFTVFGGSYAGSLGASLSAQPTFTWKAAIANLDVAALTAFAGNPGVLTGRMTAQVNLTGAGVDAATAMKTARGTATVTIAQGVVKNLALVKSAVAATSLDPQAVIASSQGTHDEPFSELGASLAVAAGTASTQDLHFVSKDLRLDAGGALKLDGSAVNLQGAIRLSPELSAQANATIVRFTQDNGQITLPATVRGVAGKYSIEIDANSVATRALANEARSQASQAARKGLGRLLGR